HVEALARDRMDDMRGIADQRETLGDEGARHEIGQRERARLVERLDLAEMQAEPALELAVELLVAQRDDARGFAAALGPHQRGSFAGERQNREGTRRQEVLLGAAVVIALMADGDDDAGLIVLPAM